MIRYQVAVLNIDMEVVEVKRDYANENVAQALCESLNRIFEHEKTDQIARVFEINSDNQSSE